MDCCVVSSPFLAQPKPFRLCFILISVLESRDEETAKLFVKAEKDLYEKTISAHAR